MSYPEITDGLDDDNAWLMRRVLTPAPVPGDKSVAPPCPRPQTDRVLFCLHPVTVPSPAGCVCSDCGVVLSGGPGMIPPPGNGRRVPVVAEDSVQETQPHSAGLTEWQLHTQLIQDQPREVMDSACRVFRSRESQRPRGPRRQQAYGRQPLSGNKARDPVEVNTAYPLGKKKHTHTHTHQTATTHHRDFHRTVCLGPGVPAVGQSPFVW